MKVKISDIAILNKSNIDNNNKFKEIKYLDTGSIFEGRVIKYKNFKVGEDIIPTRAKRLVSDNTIVYSSVRPRLCHYGILDKPSENTVVSTGFVTIDAISNKVNPYYLYYKLIQNEVTEYLAAIADTAVSAYPSITPTDLANLEIDIIEDINEQEKIAMLFKCIDIKIQNNNKINSELESMAKTIYDYWFLQFEFPNEEGKPYKSSGGKMVWNEELGREIPEGWEVDSIINNRMVSVIKPGVSYFDNKNYLATANVTGNNITDGNWVTYENRESRANMQPILNSIWFAKMKNSIKHITLTDTCEWFVDKYILSTGFVGLKCNEISLEYMHCFINSDSFEYVKDMLSHGATQEAVNNDDLKSIKLIIPTDNYLRKCSEQVNSLIKLVSKNIIENQQLSSLRDFLLPLLMNGQVGFKENINAKDIEFGKEEVLT